MKIKDIIKKNKFLNFKKNQLVSDLSDSDLLLYKKIENFTDEYICYNNLKPLQILEYHTIFLNGFTNDLKKFFEDQKYPFQRSKNIPNYSRAQYDISLLLSCLLTRHRFEIMKNVNESIKSKLKNVAFIGVGPGLEIDLIKDRCDSFQAYETNISEFISYKFHSSIKEEYFSETQDKFKCIFAIELLEHLSDPFKLINDIYHSLETETGFAYITTAKNIPQFDHLYNFVFENEFDESLRQIGFKIIHKKIIPHSYSKNKVDINNIFYKLKK